MKFRKYVKDGSRNANREKLALRHLQYKVSSLSIPLEYLVIALTQNLIQGYYLYLQSKLQSKHSSPISNVVTAIWHIYNYLVYLSLFDMSDHKLQIRRERIANITHNQSIDQCKMKVHTRSIQYESHAEVIHTLYFFFAMTVFCCLSRIWNQTQTSAVCICT